MKNRYREVVVCALLLNFFMNKAMERSISHKEEKEYTLYKKTIKQWKKIVDKKAEKIKSLKIKSRVFDKDMVTVGVKSGYLFLLSPYFSENRNDVDLLDLYILEQRKDPDLFARKDDWEKRGIAVDTDVKEIARLIVNKYKIHLMPRDEEMTPLFKNVVALTKNDKLFCSLVHMIKFYPDYSQTKGQQLRSRQEEKIKGSNEFVVPRVVMYPQDGKENVQKLLQYLCNTFAHFKGLGILPRFNEKITDLIYVAQGDGDFKEIEKFNTYFEPDKVYYSSAYFSKHGITENMRLTLPEKQ